MMARGMHMRSIVEISVELAMKYIVQLVLVGALVFGAGTVAFADGPAALGERIGDRRKANHRAAARGRHRAQRYDGDRHRVSQHRGVPVSVPELDPGALGGTMVLLLGGMAVLAERRRRPQADGEVLL